MAGQQNRKEQRKYAILFAPTLLSARKLMEMMEEEGPNMGKEFWAEQWVNKAIDRAAFILEKIEKR